MNDVWTDRIIVLSVGAVALCGIGSVAALAVNGQPIPDILTITTSSAVGALIGWVAKSKIEKERDRDHGSSFTDWKDEKRERTEGQGKGHI